ncbi:ABC transporter permease [Roseomonas marmotae]|uniref:ABC transporter permease n=1 Tax=Roseomonas marmotae TaxID=2768161 RepID=UPI001F00CCBF|nr:ABC transporter permease subunit [Roseomonas marmotae]
MLLLILLPAPLVVVIGASFHPTAVLRFPPDGFSLRWYEEFLGSAIWIRALGISALIAVAAAILTTLAALGAALALERAPERLRSVAETMILLPLLFPHAAIGIAFLGWLIAVQMNGTGAGILIAHLMLCAPFAYRPIAVALRQIDPSLAEAARVLGADERAAFSRVRLPLLRPGLSASLLFSFIVSFDEVTVTMFLIGPEVTTLPVAIYGHLHDSADPVVAAISSLLIVFTSALVLLAQRSFGLKIFVDVEEDSRRA